MTQINAEAWRYALCVWVCSGSPTVTVLHWCASADDGEQGVPFALITMSPTALPLGSACIGCRRHAASQEGYVRTSRLVGFAAPVVSAALSLSLSSAQLNAQAVQQVAPTLRCVLPDGHRPGDAPAHPDGECVIRLPTPSQAADPQRAVIRVVVGGAAAGQGLETIFATFRTAPRDGPAAGTLSADSVTVGANGDASVVWFRPVGVNAAAGVTVTVRTGGGTATRYFRIVPVEAPSVPTYILVNPNGEEYDTNPRWGFENTRLRRPLLAEVREFVGPGAATAPVTDPATCHGRRILFRRLGGTGNVMPDTAIPAVVDRAGNAAEPKSCQADVRWVLGDGPGTFEARAALVGRDSASLPIEYRAHARSLPKFIAALGGTSERDFVTQRPARYVTRRIERPLPGGGTEAFDTTITVAPVDTMSAGGRTRSNAIVGMSFAPTAHPALKGLTALVGVDPRYPADNWYFGISILRLLAYGGIATEHIPLDGFVTADVGRVTQLKNPEDCAASRTSDACATEDPRKFRGWGFAVALDATSLISDAIKKVAGF